MRRGLLAVVGVAVLAAIAWLAFADEVAPPAPDLDVGTNASRDDREIEGRSAEPTGRTVPVEREVRDGVDIVDRQEPGRARMASEVAGLDVFVRIQGRGAAPAGLSVSARPFGDVSEWGPRITRTTASGGVARFESLPWDVVEVRCGYGGRTVVRLTEGEATAAELLVPAGFEVRGRVVDEHGGPVPDAEVWMSDVSNSARGQVVAATDPDGFFEIAYVDRSRFVAARAAGFLPSQRFLVEPARANPTIELVRGPVAHLAGRVVDAHGRGIQGANVLVGEESDEARRRAADGSWAPGPPPRLATTDDSGAFLVESLTPGSCPVRARAVGFGSGETEAQLIADLTFHCEIVLLPQSTIEGMVLLDGEPVGRARVTADGDGFRGTAVLSDDRGHYLLEGLGEGDVELVATHSDGTAHARLELAAGVDYAYDLELTRGNAVESGYRLRGRVIFSRADHPHGFTVFAYRSGSVAGRREVAHTGTGDRFSMSVPWQHVAVSAQPSGAWGKGGFPSIFVADHDVLSGELELRVEDAIREACTIRGRARHDGAPEGVARVEVWHETEKHYAIVHADPTTGRFELTSVRPGPNRIVVDFPGRAWLPIGTKVLKPGEILDLGDLRPAEEGWIRGSVTVSAGSIPSELEILLLRGAVEVGAVTYTTGSFRSNAVVPGDDYTLIIRGAGYVLQRVPVRVVAAETTRLSVELDPAAVRVLEFEWVGRERPEWFVVNVERRAPAGIVWNGGPEVHRPNEVRASVPLGEYEIVLYAPGSEVVGRWPLAVESLAPAEPILLRVE